MDVPHAEPDSLVRQPCFSGFTLLWCAVAESQAAADYQILSALYQAQHSCYC